MPVEYGDLVLCLPVVLREAAEQAKAPRAHLAHLTVHGTLHLLGYTHDGEPDAQRMEALETCILAGLGIADPYVMK
jgi:probable rRNA maturation factor